MPSFVELLSQNQPVFQTRQALLILGLQNDFLSPDAKLPVNTRTGFLDRIQALVPKFRSIGDVVWIRTEFEGNRRVNSPSGNGETVVVKVNGSGPDSDDATAAVERERGVNSKDDPASLNPTMVLPQSHAGDATEDSKQRESNSHPSQPGKSGLASAEDEELFLSATSTKSPCCIPKSRGADLADSIKPLVDKAKDFELTKTYYSAFNSTSLLLTLRTNLVTEVYICGCLTNMSVFATAMDAARHGLTINIIEDCLGYRNEMRHREAIRKMKELMGAYTISSTDLFAELAEAIKVGGSTASKRGSTEIVRLQDLLQRTSSGSGSEFPRKRRQQHRNPPSEHAQNSHRTAPSAAEGLTKNEIISCGGVQARAVPLEGSDSSESALIADLRSRTRRARSVQSAVSASSNESGKRMVQNKLRVRKSLPAADQNAMRTNTYNGVQTNTSQYGSTRAICGLASETIRCSSSSSLLGSPPEPVPHTKPDLEPTIDPITDSIASMARLSLSQPSASQTAVAPMGQVTSATKVLPSAFQPLSPIPPIPRMPRNRPLASLPAFGPGDQIAEHDSHIIEDLLPPPFSHEVFNRLSQEVEFQKMYHADGEVPRLVAVQGQIGEDGSLPIYRHPSDQAPTMRPFSPTVEVIRHAVEKTLGHPVNHALIQLYRSGQDNISEHSDKTLDIVHGSSIANVSFGAQRTMRLRTKKSATARDYLSALSVRQTQRVRMPHNSMFVLGAKTNMRWLHGIQPDKRLAAERSPAENAFQGQRISLTFRNIGTFIDKDRMHIWGQGARSKDQATAGKVISGDARETARMIHTFGLENQSSEFDWNKVYGEGSDVLHFKTPPASSPIPSPLPTLTLASHDDGTSPLSNVALKIYIGELELPYRVPVPSTPDTAASGPVEQCEAASFQDNDINATNVRGAIPILLYLDKYYQKEMGSKARPASAEVYHLLFAPMASGPGSNCLLRLASSREEISAMATATPDLELEMKALSTSLGDGRPFLTGDVITIMDCLYWPLIDAWMKGREGTSREEFSKLEDWWDRLKGRESVRRAVRSENVPRGGIP